jgi:hypothetical protein
MTDLTLQQRANITFSLPPEQIPTTCIVSVDNYDEVEIIKKIHEKCTSDPCLHYKNEILSYINNHAFVTKEHANKFKNISFHDMFNNSILTIANNDKNVSDHHMAVRMHNDKNETSKTFNSCFIS